MCVSDITGENSGESNDIRPPPFQKVFRMCRENQKFRGFRI